MGNYSKEEIRAFKLKDILNSRMSALKAAATNNEGKGKKAEVLKKEADEYYTWLRQDQGDRNSVSSGQDKYDKAREIEKEVVGKQLPEPTLAQKKVLDVIAGRFPGVSEEEIKRATLKWANEIYGVNSYPTKTESVDLFSEWYREKN